MRGDAAFITAEELAELNQLRDNVDAAQAKHETARQFLVDEESLLRAAVIRIARRYGFSPTHAIDLDTGAVKKMAPPAPNADGAARGTPAGDRGRRPRAAGAAGTGAGGLRAGRSSRVASVPDNGAAADDANTRDAGA